MKARDPVPVVPSRTEVGRRDKRIWKLWEARRLLDEWGWRTEKDLLPARY